MQRIRSMGKYHYHYTRFTRLMQFVEDLVKECKEQLEKRLNKPIKPIRFIYKDQGAYATEYTDRIEFNVLLTASAFFGASNIDWVTRRVFGILIHEVVGHERPPIIPPARVVAEEMDRLKLDTEKRRVENLPLHFQMAMLGYKECRDRLVAAGHGNELKAFDTIWNSASCLVYIRWTLGTPPRHFDYSHAE